VPPSSLGAWQIDVADRKGIFQRQGIAVERVPDEAKNVADALNAGKSDVALVSTEAVVRASRAGQSLTMVAGALNRAAYSLIATRGVEDIGGLKGRPIGVRDPEDITAVIANRMLKARGLDEADYRLIGFEDIGVRAAAVANGSVGASLLDPASAARLEADDFRWIGAASGDVPDFQAEVLATRADWARQNEQLLVRFLKAIVEADRWIYEARNRQEAVDILASTLTLSPAQAGGVYEQYVERVPSIPREGELDAPGVRAVIELLAETEAIRPPLPDPARMTDVSYLQKAK
jgi:NitT/TauT family transport system substrate-binding protein